jgi:hypothetical protein
MIQTAFSRAVLYGLVSSLLFLLACGPPFRGGDDDDSAAGDDDDSAAADDDDDSAAADDDDDASDDDDDDDSVDPPDDDDDGPELTGNYSGQMTGTLTLTDPQGGTQIETCAGTGVLDVATGNLVTGNLVCNSKAVGIPLEVPVDAHQVPGSMTVPSVGPLGIDYLVTLGIGTGSGDLTVIEAEIFGSADVPSYGSIEIEASGVLQPPQ